MGLKCIPLLSTRFTMYCRPRHFDHCFTFWQNKDVPYLSLNIEFASGLTLKSMSIVHVRKSVYFHTFYEKKHNYYFMYLMRYLDEYLIKCMKCIWWAMLIMLQIIVLHTHTVEPNQYYKSVTNIIWKIRITKMIRKALAFEICSIVEY